MILEEAYRLSKVEYLLDGKKINDNWWDNYVVYRWENKNLVVWFDGKDFLLATDLGIVTREPVAEKYISNKHDWRIWTGDRREFDTARSNKTQ